MAEGPERALANVGSDAETADLAPDNDGEATLELGRVKVPPGETGRDRTRKLLGRETIRQALYAAGTTLIVLAVCVVIYLVSLACYVITDYATKNRGDNAPAKSPTKK